MRTQKGVYMEEINVHEEFVKKVVSSVDMTKPESVKAANDVLKTYQDGQIKEAELQQNERSLDIQERRLEHEEKELKHKKVETYVTNGVSVATIFASIGMAIKYMKFEEAGHAITSAVGRTIVSGFKLFGKLK